MIQSVQPRQVFMGRLAHGSDLLRSLTQLCKENNIRLGGLTVIGAVQAARLQYYNQPGKEYQESLIEEPLEITSLVGNISEKDGQPFVHAHLTLANREGRVFGGHLAEGTVVFAAEFTIEAYEGPALQRRFDGVTGLSLWR